MLTSHLFCLLTSSPLFTLTIHKSMDSRWRLRGYRMGYRYCDHRAQVTFHVSPIGYKLGRTWNLSPSSLVPIEWVPGALLAPKLKYKLWNAIWLEFIWHTIPYFLMYLWLCSNSAAISSSNIASTPCLHLHFQVPRAEMFPLQDPASVILPLTSYAFFPFLITPAQLILPSPSLSLEKTIHWYSYVIIHILSSAAL